MKKILFIGALLFSMIINAQIKNLNDLISYFRMDTSSFYQSLNKNPNWKYRGIGYKNVYGRNNLVKEYYNFN